MSSTTYNLGVLGLSKYDVGGGVIKFGLSVGLGDSGDIVQYEFDTGASGFYPASLVPAASGTPPSGDIVQQALPWWPDIYDTVKNPGATNLITQTYSSGKVYSALPVATSVSLPGLYLQITATTATAPLTSVVLNNSSLSASSIAVGAIVEVSDTQANSTFPYDWSSSLSAAAAAWGTANYRTNDGPLYDFFYGDFGVALGAGQGKPTVQSVFAQFSVMNGGSNLFLGNGFIVDVGAEAVVAHPASNDGPASVVGSVIVGDVDVLVGLFPYYCAMAPAVPSGTFSGGNGLSTFAEGLISGTFSVEAQDTNPDLAPPKPYVKNGVSFVLDTGCPSPEIHTGNSTTAGFTPLISSDGLKDYVDKKCISSGFEATFTVALETQSYGSDYTPPAAPSPLLIVSAADNAIGVTDVTASKPVTTPPSIQNEGYVNIGLPLFYAYIVMFDLKNSVIRFLPRSMLNGQTIDWTALLLDLPAPGAINPGILTESAIVSDGSI